jgi:hypothetical protein
MKFRFTAALLCLAAAAPAAAQPITPEALRRHVDVLASDAFEGREPGTEGEKKTIAYISAQMRAAGLEAGVGTGFYQPLDVVVRKPGDQRIVFEGRKKKRDRIELDRDAVLLLGPSTRETLVSAPVIFAGHGAVAEDRGIDQLAGADLRGAIVLILYDGPHADGFPSYAERVRSVAARGAAAVIGIVGAEMPWPVLQRVYDRGQNKLGIDPPVAIQGVMTQAGAQRLFTAARGDFAAALAADGRAFRPVALKLRGSLDVTTSIRTIRTNNVVGRLRGTGTSGDSLLFLGHWDHLGICEPEAADKICNGAVDNASGIAAMLEIARALAKGPRPKRDILFLATTSEEMGLLGAHHFAARPVVPLGSIVAAINMDTVAIGPRGEKVAVIGRGDPVMDRILEGVIREAGRVMDEDDEAAAFVTRQDGWALQAAGVPALMIGGSFADMKKLQAFLQGPYHSAADNPGPHIELGGAAEDAELMVALGRKLADPAVYPGRPAPKP